MRSSYPKPYWWNAEDDFTWDCARAAFRREWEQLKQSSPGQDRLTFEEAEPALRLGLGARRYYGERFSEWDEALEIHLEEDWRATHRGETNSSWRRFQEAVRLGWEWPEREEPVAGSPTAKRHG